MNREASAVSTAEEVGPRNVKGRFVIGIDGSHAGAGGGVENLIQLICFADWRKFNFDKIVLWGPAVLLSGLPVRERVEYVPVPVLRNRLLKGLLWKTWTFPKTARGQCDILLVPSGVFFPPGIPVVSMCTNLLPFDRSELSRYRGTRDYVRLLALRYLYKLGFLMAHGVIFPSDHARKCAFGHRRIPARAVTISHGVDDQFALPPRAQRPITAYTAARPFEFLYVSNVQPYKHHPEVVRAVAALRARGLAVSLRIVGPGSPESLRLLQDAMRRVDPNREFLFYEGSADRRTIHEKYHRADAFVMASTCETFSRPLLEAMAAGLPVACSRRQPMSSILGDAGLYFEPEDTDTIELTLLRLVNDEHLRARCASQAFERAKSMSARMSAEATLRLIRDVWDADAAHNRTGSPRES